MLNFSFPRLPFRDDRLFGVLMLLFLTVPLMFTFGVYEKYETVKFFLFLIFTGTGLFCWGFNPTFARVKAKGLFWIFFLLMTVLGFLAMIFSLDKVSGFLGSYPRFSNGYLFLVVWLILLLLLLPVIKDSAKRLFFYKLVFFDAIVISLVGIVQSIGFGYYESLNMPIFARAPSLLGNPNFSTMFLAAILPMAVPLFFLAKKNIAKIYYVLGAFSIILAVIFLSSRGGWIGLFAAFFTATILTLIFRFPKKQILAYILLIAAGLSLWWLFFQFTPREHLVNNTFKLNETNVNLRLYVWDISRQAILDKPLFGYGPGNFILAFEKFRGINLADQPGVFDDPHNLFLHQAVLAGIPFALAFLGLFVLAAWVGFKKAKKFQDNFTIAALSGFVSLLVMACFNPFSIPNYALLALFSACLLVDDSMTINEENNSFKLSFKFLKIGAKIIGLILIVVGVLFFLGEILFYKGADEYNKGKFANSANFLNAALKANPFQELSRVYLAADSIKLGYKKEIVQEKIRQATNLHKNRASAFATASNLYYLWFYQTGQVVYLDLAAENLKKSMEKDPYFTRRYGRLGYYYLLKGKTEQAIAYIKLNLSFEPEYMPGWLILAKAYQVDGKKEQVVSALKKAAQINPEFKDLGILVKIAEKADDIRKVFIPGGVLPDILE